MYLVSVLNKRRKQDQALESTCSVCLGKAMVSPAWQALRGKAELSQSSASPSSPKECSQSPQEDGCGIYQDFRNHLCIGGCPAEPTAHPDLLDFITCTRAPQSTVPDCFLGIMGGSGPFSSYQSSRAEGLTHLPLQNGAGMELGWSWGGGQPKGGC